MGDDPFSDWRSEKLRKEALARRILGVSTSAEKDEIRKAYRKRALTLHPDRNVDNSATDERFINVTNAYVTLTKGKDVALFDDMPDKNPDEDNEKSTYSYFMWWNKQWGR